MTLSEEILQSVPFTYAADVRSGKMIVGNYVKKAVERFYKLLEEADSKGYVLDHANGMHVIDFFSEFLKHTTGNEANHPFVLAAYQQCTVYSIFAWKKQNQEGKWVRVVKTVCQQVARKNGKTAVLAGLGLYCQAFDGEETPEI